MIYKDIKSDLQKTAEIAASLNPNEYEIIPFPRPMVDAVDSLVRLAKEHGSPNKMVESESDWKVVEGIFKIWALFCPEEYKAFSKSQKEVRQGLYNENAITRGSTGHDQGKSAVGQHQLNLPMHFDAMMRAIYPNQKWTRKFIVQIAKRFPILKVPEKF